MSVVGLSALETMPSLNVVFPHERESRKTLVVKLAFERNKIKWRSEPAYACLRIHSAQEPFIVAKIIHNAKTVCVA
jgi:hypothetical protein